MKTTPQNLDLLGLLAAFAERRWSWLIGSIIAGIVAIGISLVLPKSYRSFVTVLPAEGTSGGGYLSLLGGVSLPATWSGSSVDARELITLLNSRALRRPLIDEFDLQTVYGKNNLEDTFLTLRNTLSVEPEIEGGIASIRIVSLTIAVEDDEPERAANMVNFLLDRLQEQVIEITRHGALARGTYLQEVVEETRGHYAAAVQALEEFSQRTGIFALEPQVQGMANNLAQAEATVAGAAIQAHLVEKLYGPEHPLRRLAETKLEEATRARDELLHGDQGGAGVAISELPGLQREYFDLFLQSSIQQALLEQLIPQLTIARMESGYDQPRLRVVDRGYTPDKKYKPKRAYVVVALCLIYQLLWFMRFFFQERLKLAQRADPELYERWMAALRVFHLPLRSQRE